MKIYTRVVFDWDGNVIEEDSYDYDGPIAHCGGGGSQTTVQKADPWSGAQPHLLAAYDEAAKLFNQGGPQYYQGQTYADRTPMEMTGRGMQADIAAGLQGTSGNLLNATNSALNATDVANNPYVGGMADMITGRLNRNLTENLMPAANMGAMAAGQLGGGRHGVMQGQAMGRTQEALGDSLAQLYGDAYSQGLDAQTKALGLAPTAMQGALMPGQSMQQLGLQDREFAQLGINDEIARWNASQLQPQENLDAYLARVSGSPWNTTSTMSGGGGSPLTGALGGAMLGGSIAGGLSGTSLGASMGSALGPIGTIGGAILGGLFA